MAVGTPVVSTSVGCMGLPVQDGRDILIANGATFAKRVIEVIQQPELAKDLATNARALVERDLTWDKSFLSLSRIYSEF